MLNVTRKSKVRQYGGSGDLFFICQLILLDFYIVEDQIKSEKC